MIPRRLNILHIEDNPADAVLVQEMILKGNNGAAYNLVNVHSLKEALQKMQSKDFNAVLLDLGLKDITGLDAVKVLKGENPEIPIIVLSGLDNEDFALRAIKEGAQEYLVKGYGDGNAICRSIRYSIERKESERRLFSQAHYDDLTGLPNHRMFCEHLKTSIERAKRWDEEIAILFLDIDNFKEINDKLGHEAGNQALQIVSARIKGVLRASDFIARYGGDEFVIELDSGQATIKMEDCNAVIEKIKTALNDPVIIEPNRTKINIQASIGIAIYPHAGKDIDKLLREADQDMYLEKNKNNLVRV